MTTIFTPRIEFLDVSEVERTIGEACRVLETTGVLVENEEASALLLEGGAEFVGERITIPERLVREALESVPSRILLFDRDGEPAMDLAERRIHFDPGSAAIAIIDRATGRKRRATVSDATDLARLVDRLPHYAAQSTALVPADVPVEIGDRMRLYISLVNCRKPIVTGTFRKDGFVPMRAMLAAVRGGEVALAEKPLAIFDCCVTPPLKWSDLTAQSLVDCARALIPAEVISMPLAGATSPVTIRETVVQHCAENFSGLVIHQLARSGAPFIFGSACSAFDMRNGTTPLGAMETMMLGSACAQVGRHVGLPTHGYFGASDSKTLDYQAGLESGMSTLIGALAGINVISGPGMLDFLLTQSLEKIVLDHEACGLALRAVRGIERTESEAVALIGEVAKQGEFLSHPHTRKHWRRELSVASRLIDRSSYGDWEGGGARSAAQRAADEVDRLLAEPGGPELEQDVRTRLDEIMRGEGAKIEGREFE